MATKKTTIEKWALGSIELQDAFTDFILSRQATLCSENTILYYRFTCGAFVKWLEGQNVTRPEETSARHVRAYLAELAGRGLSDRTVFDHAGGIRTMLRFWYAEKYLSQSISFTMPKVAQKRLLSLDAETLQKVINACDNPRDKAIIMFMADSGSRRAETITLNWGDVDIQSRLVRIRKGKGGKARSVVIGAATRRALLKYRRTVKDHTDNAPLFQAKGGRRFTGKGFREIFVRLNKRSGIQVNAHSLRRTWAILCLRAGISPLHVQALGGWASLDMVKHYAQMVDDDLLQAHKQASPVDHLAKLRKK